MVAASGRPPPVSGQPAALAEPQPVEVWHQGGWHPALLLGCQLQADGSWLARIRFPSLPLPLDDWTRQSHVRPANPGTQQPPVAPRRPVMPPGGRHRAVLDEPAADRAGRLHCEPPTTRLPLSPPPVPPQRAANSALASRLAAQE
jgi:hypothetical protein